MLDCCEKKIAGSTDGVVPTNTKSEMQEPELPLSQRKVSFHRRFVESQKELTIVQEKLLHAERFNKSLHDQLTESNSVSQEKTQRAADTIEQLQHQLTQAQQQLRNESDRHQETQLLLLKTEDAVYSLEDEMNKMHDSRLDVIDLSRRLDSLSTDDPIVASEERAQHETTKTDLLAAQNVISSLTASLERLRALQRDKDEKVKELISESKTTIDDFKSQLERQESEMTILRTDRVALQSQIERCRSLLWEVEESRHYHRQKWNKLAKSIDGYEDIERDRMIRELTIEQCKSISTTESLRRKNRQLEMLNKSLSEEICKKNNVICQMSCTSSVLAASETFKVEQERSLNMATELSVAYAESQMKVDRLTETVNRLKVEQMQKVESPNSGTPFRSVIRNKSYQLQQPTSPSKQDGGMSISSIFTKSLNLSFSGLDTPTSSSNNNNDSRLLKVDLLSMKIPQVDLTVSCGNVSGIKIAKGMKNTAISMELNHNKEKVNMPASLNDKGDMLSQTATDNDQCFQKKSLVEKGCYPIKKELLYTNEFENKANGATKESLSQSERPMIISI